MTIPLNMSGMEEALKRLIQDNTPSYDVVSWPDSIDEFLRNGFGGYNGSICVTTRQHEIVKITESVKAPLYEVDLVYFYSNPSVDVDSHTEGLREIETLHPCIDGQSITIGEQAYKIEWITGRFFDQLESYFVWVVRLRIKHKMYRN